MNKHRLRITVYILLMMVGVALIMVGGLLKGFDNTAWITATGGATMGTAISLLIRAALGSDIEDLHNLIMDKKQMLSDPGQAVKCDGRWHLYYTSRKHGRRIWQYVEVDFVVSKVFGTLTGNIQHLGKTKTSVMYKYRGAVRDDRLIIMSKADDSDEPTSVFAFKGVTIQHYGTYFGVILHQTWDGPSAVSAGILSRTPIEGIEGRALTDEHFAKLDDAWLREADNQSIQSLLPQAFVADSRPVET
jgi:hypothetical protein